MIWTRTKTLNGYTRAIMQIVLIQSEICHTFHYHVNIIPKPMTEFVTELVETLHFFSIVTNFSVQAMWSLSFQFKNPFAIMIASCGCSFDIALWHGYIEIIAFAVTFVKMFCKFAIVWVVFDVVAMFREELWKLFPWMSNI